MALRHLVAVVVTAAATIAVTNAMKSKQAERDLWAEASDVVD